MKNELRVILVIFLLAAITINAASKPEINPDTIKLKQGYSLHLADVDIDKTLIAPEWYRNATLQLIYHGNVIDTKLVEIGSPPLPYTGNFELYDGTTLIVSGEDIRIFFGQTVELIMIHNLTQYNGNKILYQESSINLYHYDTVT